jgi:hypothetical protein
MQCLRCGRDLLYLLVAYSILHERVEQHVVSYMFIASRNLLCQAVLF